MSYVKQPGATGPDQDRFTEVWVTPVTWRLDTFCGGSVHVDWDCVVARTEFVWPHGAPVGTIRPCTRYRSVTPGDSPVSVKVRPVVDAMIGSGSGTPGPPRMISYAKHAGFVGPVQDRDTDVVVVPVTVSGPIGSGGVHASAVVTTPCGRVESRPLVPRARTWYR